MNLNSNNNFFSIKTLVYGILLASVFIIPILIIKFGIAYSLIYSLIPAVLIYLVVVMSNPYWGLVIIFIFNYFIMGITRYIPIQGGIAIDMLIITTILGVVIQTINGKIHWIRIKSPLILLS